MSPTARDWAELVRLPAVVSVPGDTLVGLAAGGGRLDARALCLPAASVSMYWAGMALNDWADRDLDALERPERPLPSGRVSPGQAFGAAALLTAASVALAGFAGGRRSAATATALAAAVWTYDLVGKPSRLAPLSMALTRVLDVALGASAGRPGDRGDVMNPAPGPRTLLGLGAAATGLHTLALTDLSRAEVHGAAPAAGSRAAVVTLLATGTVVTLLARRGAPATTPAVAVAGRVVGVLALLAHTVPLVRAQTAAGRSGTGPDARAATVTGIKAFLPLQAALLAALGRPGHGLGLAALATVAAGRLRGGSAS